MSDFISIIRTYPVLLQRFSFTAVLAALGAIVIVFRALTGFRDRRLANEQQKDRERE
jgi:hypothetical protein